MASSGGGEGGAAGGGWPEDESSEMDKDLLRLVEQLFDIANCPVCFEHYPPIRILKCGHSMHAECAVGQYHASFLAQPTCPLCRANLLPRRDRGDLRRLYATSMQSPTCLTLRRILGTHHPQDPDRSWAEQVSRMCCCYVCNHAVRNPVTLDCCHTVCLECLEKGVMRCPGCRLPFESYRPNHALNSILELVQGHPDIFPAPEGRPDTPDRGPPGQGEAPSIFMERPRTPTPPPDSQDARARLLEDREDRIREIMGRPTLADMRREIAQQQAGGGPSPSYELRDENGELIPEGTPYDELPAFMLSAIRAMAGDFGPQDESSESGSDPGLDFSLIRPEHVSFSPSPPTVPAESPTSTIRGLSPSFAALLSTAGFLHLPPRPATSAAGATPTPVPAVRAPPPSSPIVLSSSTPTPPRPSPPGVHALPLQPSPPLQPLPSASPRVSSARPSPVARSSPLTSTPASQSAPASVPMAHPISSSEEEDLVFQEQAGSGGGGGSGPGSGTGSVSSGSGSGSGSGGKSRRKHREGTPWYKDAPFRSPGVGDVDPRERLPRSAKKVEYDVRRTAVTGTRRVQPSGSPRRRRRSRSRPRPGSPSRGSPSAGPSLLPAGSPVRPKRSPSEEQLRKYRQKVRKQAKEELEKRRKTRRRKYEVLEKLREDARRRKKKMPAIPKHLLMSPSVMPSPDDSIMVGSSSEEEEEEEEEEEPEGMLGTGTTSSSSEDESLIRHSLTPRVVLPEGLLTPRRGDTKHQAPIPYSPKEQRRRLLVASPVVGSPRRKRMTTRSQVKAIEKAAEKQLKKIRARSAGPTDSEEERRRRKEARRRRKKASPSQSPLRRVASSSPAASPRRRAPPSPSPPPRMLLPPPVSAPVRRGPPKYKRSEPRPPPPPLPPPPRHPPGVRTVKPSPHDTKEVILAGSDSEGQTASERELDVEVTEGVQHMTIPGLGQSPFVNLGLFMQGGELTISERGLQQLNKEISSLSSVANFRQMARDAGYGTASINFGITAHSTFVTVTAGDPEQCAQTQQPPLVSACLMNIGRDDDMLQGPDGAQSARAQDQGPGHGQGQQ